MRIAYVARHEPVGNCDENAITYALRQLGHEVTEIGEANGHWVRKDQKHDLLLFHKWHDVESLRRSPIPAKAFWWFDLVDWPSDPSLAGRCAGRRQWMADVVPHVGVGFCTDGDWVDRVNEEACRTELTSLGDAETRWGRGKLVWLPQGADERVVGWGDLTAPASCVVCRGPWAAPKILFTGISRGGGRDRVSFVEEMAYRYGAQFRHVPHGVHGRALADLVAQSEVVVCPDSPVTHKYWSNRVWNAAGFGAFILHPFCGRLSSMMEGEGDGQREIVYYKSREELHALIAHWSALPQERTRVGAYAIDRVRRQHLYRHRCEELVRVVRERFFNGREV